MERIVNNTDPRLGLPSASGADRWMNCPGSWQLESRLPEPPESEDAKRGTLMHVALAKGSTWAAMNLSGEDLDIVEQVRKEMVSVIPLSSTVTENREERLYLLDNNTEEIVASGQPDLLVRCIETGHSYIADAKFGYQEVDAAGVNAQMATLAVIEAATNAATNITVAIVQPGRKPSKTTAVYEGERLQQAKEAVYTALAATRHPKASRFAGPWCKYCRARPICPEFAQALAVEVVPKKAKRLPLDKWTPADWLRFVDMEPLARKTLADIKDAMHARLLANPSAIPGLELSPPGRRETIIDLPRLFERLADRHGITAEQFTAKCGITKTAVEHLIQDATKDLPHVTVERLAKTVIDGCVRVDETERKVRRKKQ